MSAMPRRAPSTRPKFGKLPAPPESNILSHTLDYCAWEKIWTMRLTAGTARVGGQPIRLPSHIIAMVTGLAEMTGKKWDGRIRIGEQWAKLADKGTPDILFMLPAMRRALNTSVRELESFPVARIGFIETKTESGRLSKEQKEFKNMCRSVGALHFIVRNPEQLRECLPSKMELQFTAPSEHLSPG